MTTAAPLTLLDFIDRDGRSRLVALSALQSDARAELERVRDAFVAAEEDVKDLERLTRRRDAVAAAVLEARQAAAAARALGEAPEDTPSGEELPLPGDIRTAKETLEGLRRRMAEVEEKVQSAEQEYRSAQVEELLVNGRRNASKKWVQLAKASAETWAVLDSAESLGASLYGPSHALLGTETWGRFTMPGCTSKELPELAGISEETATGAQVFDASNARQRGLTVQALARLANTFRREIGEFVIDRRRP